MFQLNGVKCKSSNSLKSCLVRPHFEEDGSTRAAISVVMFYYVYLFFLFLFFCDKPQMKTSEEPPHKSLKTFSIFERFFQV